ncbi:uncharacterized protein [Ptychodera flava]|uniref:uncharacterized protein n=1 Tax=Ptychodera flava TaxID=63121 RepID=UPI00396A3B2A
MKRICIVTLVSLLSAFSVSQGTLVKREGGVDECYHCAWTPNVEECLNTTKTQNCGNNMKCATRLRLIDDGEIQMKTGCRTISWLAKQDKCEVNGAGEMVVAETCVVECDGSLCNNHLPTLVKGVTDRHCRQCDWSSSRYCGTSCSCPMSEGACATQVKFTEDGGKHYSYKCYQKFYCQKNLMKDNEANCGSSPDEAANGEPGQICGYCTDNIRASNSNP